MISITSIESATIDGVIFDEDPASEFRTESARVVRTKTLTGGAVVDHRGFADGDRTFKISAAVDQDTEDALWYLFRNNTILNLSCKEGFFDGAISEMSSKNGRIELTFLVRS